MSAQLNGVYTCANGNPSGAFDYASISDFLGALVNGMTGPVTLEVYDDGGPFVSGVGYVLIRNIPGRSLANPLVIRAAAGEHPVISGFVPNTGFDACLILHSPSYTTISGLTFQDSPFYGLYCETLLQPAWNFRLTGCRIHNIAGAAIFFEGTSSNRANAVIVENNMIWDCGKSDPSTPGGPVISAIRPGIEWSIRHNTILHSPPPGSGPVFAFGIGTSMGTVDEVVGNVVYASGTTNIWQSTSPAVIFVDYNMYFVVAPAGFGPTFAAWQAAGNDPHGVIANPQLVNVNPGFEDLHLQATSPAIDFMALARVNVDIEGDARPTGFGRDAGADEYVPPDISIEYAAAVVPSVSVLNLGNIPPAGAAYNFTMRNNGVGKLQLTGTPPVALIPGTNCGAATAVTLQPATPVAPAGFTAFTLFIQPAALGPLDFVISINSNDPVKSPYIITINATGVATPPPNLPARALSVGGSTLAGPMNGPFNLSLNPGALLVNAGIELSDFELNTITVQSISLLSAVPAGITAPAIPAPGQPLTLTWAGLADPANTPGVYTWRVAFKDSVNGTVITSDVRFTIANLPPVHVAAAALAGTGSQGQPYECNFNRGDDGTLVVGLATVDDANTGQVVGLTSVTPAPTNPGVVGFSFTLAGGLLNVAPSAMLTVAETGVHNYSMKLTDGISNVFVYVKLTVINTPIAITTASPLPAAETGLAYSVTLQTTGAIGTKTFAVTTGALPAGLSLDLATGEITGTPTQAEVADFTVQVDDATGATATHPYQITVTDPVVPPPGKTSDGGNGCVSGNGRTLPVWLLLAALTGLALRRKDRREKAK